MRNLGCFDQVGAVFELDDTFKSLEPQSRIFSPEEPPFLREHIKATCQKYGCKLWPPHPLGYKNGQLLLGFSHNTPDNTIPMFWTNGTQAAPWIPYLQTVSQGVWVVRWLNLEFPTHSASRRLST